MTIGAVTDFYFIGVLGRGGNGKSTTEAAVGVGFNSGIKLLIARGNGY
jgi:hypothetical protein